ncbi:aminoglycoside phosphotransferase family protein [Candidatus Leptofilum sp.]|uniref:aminoglycoside phosphotransferase family protein n=1 Tax=Candidatus Leptofilum sp. TaxID=3241576 RepID=UPI003B5A808A
MGKSVVAYIVSQALGIGATIRERTPLSFQSNQLFDVWQNGRHYIAKHYLKTDELSEAPRREFEALQLLSPLDVAPQPVFYDPALGPVVVYEFLAGEMWDRMPPTAVQLQQLADLWLTLNEVPTDGLWLSRGMERTMQDVSAMFNNYLKNYEAWAAGNYSPGLESVPHCQALLARLPKILSEFSQLPDPPLLFCRSDPRFANVIQRPDGRLALVDWEDCGLRDPARDVADLLTHPNQEDLLTDEEWDAFLRPYTAARLQTDPYFNERIQYYLLLFPLFWLLGLLNAGVSYAEAGHSVHNWQPNRIPTNIQL